MPANDDKQQPIVIKKIKKGGHGHHGGAWKVAYADFVTAMMAFFLLMWLLGNTTEEQRVGISDYFENPSAIQGPGGASTSMIDFGGAMDVPRGVGQPRQRDARDLSADELAEIIEDRARLDELMQQLKEQIETSPSMKDFKDQLHLDITSEGLRIQIVDKENRPMFDLGGTELKWYTRDILRELAQTINQVPNHISIAGHTDATPYGSGLRNYSNWELSTDRANAARRELGVGGLGDGKTGRVVGLASSVLFDKENPTNPINRRISIIVLNRATERAIGLEPIEPQGDAAPGPTDAPAPAPERATGPSPAPAPAPAPAAAPDADMPVSEAERRLREVLGPPPGE